jgi:hypothetical protein
MNTTNIKEIIAAVVSNVNFFNIGASSDAKIKQVCDLIEKVNETVIKP